GRHIRSSTSTENLVVHGGSRMNMRERQEQAMHDDLEVPNHLGDFNPHVVDPHRRGGGSSSPGGGDHQRLALLQCRQWHSERQFLEIRESEVDVGDDVEPDVADV
ncbi:hypothetical protein PanWU01x14_118040, partial [Parasponia andersonii]